MPMEIVWSHPLLQIVFGVCVCVCGICIQNKMKTPYDAEVSVPTSVVAYWGGWVPPYIQLSPDAFGHLPKAVHLHKTRLTLSQVHGKLVLMVSSVCCFPAWGGVWAGPAEYVLQIIR